MKILIAIPCMDTVPVGFAQSLLYMHKPEGTSVCFRANSLVYDSRNLLSLTAMRDGCDRVLWLDSDMMFDKDILTRLGDDMDALNADFVTGLYVKRRHPTTPVIYDALDEPTVLPDGKIESNIHDYISYPFNSVFPVKGCGFGCCMTSVKMLKDVWDHFGPAFAPFTWAGEDISFCHRANLLGYKIYCDSRIKCGHIGTMVYTEDHIDVGIHGRKQSKGDVAI